MMTEAGEIVRRPSPFPTGTAPARAAVGLVVYLWCAIAPFLPLGGLNDLAYSAVGHLWPASILALAIWAFVDHVMTRKWLLAFLLVPVVTVVHFIATGAVVMLFSFLATGQMS